MVPEDVTANRHNMPDESNLNWKDQAKAIDEVHMVSPEGRESQMTTSGVISPLPNA
jgi:hypothetical protein